MKTAIVQFCVVALSVCMVSQAFASHRDDTLPPESHLQEVAKVTNTRDDGVGVLSIVLDSSDVVLGVYNEFYSNDGSGTVTRDMSTLAQIASPEGAVLHRDSGMDAIILQGNMNPNGASANLQIRYLANGLTHSYGNCRVDAKKSAQGTWSMINAYNGKVITEARARVWAFGIRTIENVCP